MSAAAAKPFAARVGDAPRVLAPRRHRDVGIAQLVLEHRDRRPGIALLALGDGDGGRVADFGAAIFEAAVRPDRVFLNELAAIVLIAHGRLG
jgi:hypothetical protein